MAYTEKLVDKRVVERNIRKGIVDPKELAKQHAQLPDVSSNAEWLEVPGSEIDDNDEE
jgi:hypothetical protein